MKICYSWISEYVAHGLSPRDLALMLTMAGLEVEGLLPYEGDWILDVKVPPNRPDCLSHCGLARELANLRRKKVRLPLFRISEAGPPVREYISVRLEEKKLCPLYTGRVVEDVTVQPSPDWLRKRLESVGVRSINNIVDVTNFVLMEYGHPLHAFDLDLLEGRMIVVRRGKTAESFTTLDGNLRVADENTLLICDEKKPVALAGIMGGASSEVRPETHRVFLESAYFDPIAIRRTSKRLFLSTESSYRFERGADPEGPVPALNRAAHLIAEVAGGKIAGGIIRRASFVPKPPSIPLTLEYVNRLLGTSLSAYDVERCITLPGYDVSPVRKSGRSLLSHGVRKKGRIRAEWRVRPPSWRVDLSRQEDLIEEISRHTGYGKIPLAIPLIPLSVPKKIKGREMSRQAREILCRAGCHEVICYSFISGKFPEILRVGGDDRLRRVIPLRNPLTEEQSVMRTTLIPGLLQALALNVRRRNMSVRIFEIGRVFRGSDKGQLPAPKAQLPEERTMLGILMAGARMEEGWNLPPGEVDYFDLKGAVEDLLEGLGIVSFRFHPAADIPYLHPGTSTRIILDGMDVGVLGRLHKDAVDVLDIRTPPFVCEMDFDAIVGLPGHEVQFTPLSRFPGSIRDIALLLDESVPAQRVLDSMTSVKDEIIKDVKLFDLYSGENIPRGKKSLAFRIHFSAEERNITDAEVDDTFGKIVSRLEKELGAVVRTPPEGGVVGGIS